MDKKLAQYWQRLQPSLFPRLVEKDDDEEVDELTRQHRRLIVTLDWIEIERFVYDPPFPTGKGRPTKCRTEIARAFVAKAVLNIPTTVALIERIKTDPPLRRILGFESKRSLPCEATFSNAFAAFAEAGLPQVVHEALVKQTFDG